MRLLINDQISQWWGLSIDALLLVWSLQERLFEHRCACLSPVLQASGWWDKYLDGQQGDNAKPHSNQFLMYFHHALPSVQSMLKITNLCNMEPLFCNSAWPMEGLQNPMNLGTYALFTHSQLQLGDAMTKPTFTHPLSASTSGGAISLTLRDRESGEEYDGEMDYYPSRP